MLMIHILYYLLILYFLIQIHFHSLMFTIISFAILDIFTIDFHQQYILNFHQLYDKVYNYLLLILLSQNHVC